MTTVFLAPAPINCTQLIPGGNVPASGGQLFSYITGSSTKQNMYTTSSGTVAYSNPLVLDSGGNIPGSKEIWIPQGLPARFILAPSTDTDPPASPYWTVDNISGMNDVSFPNNVEWILHTSSPTFSNVNNFVVSGDQTAIFTLGRRVKTVNTGGTVYGTVSSSVFVTSTTVGLFDDSGALDAGLSAVSYGVLSTPNGSVPWTKITTAGLDQSHAAVSTGPLSVTGAEIVSSIATFQSLIDASSTTAGQIKFPATQNATTDPNTLDDYQEKSFGPTIFFGGTSTGIVSNVSTGTATKLGNRVLFDLVVNLNGLGSASGAVSISSLPFPVTSGAQVPCSVWVSAFSTSASTSIMAQIVGGSISIFRTNSSGALALTNTDLLSNAQFEVSGQYRTN